MDKFFNFSEFIENLGPNILWNLLSSLVVLAVLWGVRFFILSIINKKVANPRTRYTWRKSSLYVAFSLGILMIGSIWIEEVTTIATFLGLLTAGLAIALKDPVVNFASWLFILWRRPFEVGDRIQIGDAAGDVIDIRIFQFTLMEIGNWVDADQYTGRIIHVPNGKVFTENQANYSKGSHRYIWNELPVLVTFESNWEKAKQILEEIIDRHVTHLGHEAQKEIREAQYRYVLVDPNHEPSVYTSVEDSGVMLTIRFLCEPHKRRKWEQIIWEDILRAFAAHQDIDFAYPTTRFYNNQNEGKEAKE